MSKVRTAALILAAATWTASASAAPTARFTARPVQNGSTCVAPCVVHFDAIGQGQLSATPYQTQETTDPDYDREFHSLLFEWDFGDPNSGNWAQGAASKTSTPWPKNYDRGAVAGHAYTTPGTYTATLRVTNPAGQTSTATRSIVVASAGNHFSAAATYCVATDDNNWAGCPLNCAAGDDNCVVTSDLDQALTAGDNCSGGDDCADLDAQYARVLFRRGDTFSASTAVRLTNAGGVGLIEAFGTGARPTFDFNGNLIFHGEGFTYSNLTLTDCSPNECILLDHTEERRSNRMTAYQITCNVRGPCVQYWLDYNNSAPQFPHYLTAEYEVDNNVTDSSYSGWPAADYMLHMGGTFNKNNTGIDASWRTRHMQHTVVAHKDWINPSVGFEHWQLRSWSYSNPALPNRVQAEASRFVLFQDNWSELSRQNGFASVRICNDQGCNCYNGAQCFRAVENTDFIFDSNFFFWDDQGTLNSKMMLFQAMCGGLTVRNNVVDLQGGISGGDTTLVYALGNTATQPEGNCNNDNIQVYNNTVFLDDAYSGTLTVADDHIVAGSTGCDQNCVTRNNLVVWPNGGAARLSGGGAGWTASNNLDVEAEPWASPAPEQGQSRISSFALAAGNASIVDAGYDFQTGTDRGGWVFTDAGRRCRSDGQWDIGAFEAGAQACSAITPGGPPPPPPPDEPAPLAAPVLLP